MSTERFSLVPKYTPKGELSSDEVGGSGLLAKSIKDKLILEADVNYDMQNNKASTRQNSMSGDATLSLILDRSGNLRVQAFTRTIEDFQPNQGTQESGIGIFYRENFRLSKDLVQLIQGLVSRRSRAAGPKRKAAKRQRKAAEHAGAGRCENIRRRSAAGRRRPSGPKANKAIGRVSVHRVGLAVPAV